MPSRDETQQMIEEEASVLQTQIESIEYECDTRLENVEQLIDQSGEQLQEAVQALVLLGASRAVFDQVLGHHRDIHAPGNASVALASALLSFPPHSYWSAHHCEARSCVFDHLIVGLQDGAALLVFGTVCHASDCSNETVRSSRDCLKNAA